MNFQDLSKACEKAFWSSFNVHSEALQGALSGFARILGKNWKYYGLFSLKAFKRPWDYGLIECSLKGLHKARLFKGFKGPLKTLLTAFKRPLKDFSNLLKAFKNPLKSRLKSSKMPWQILLKFKRPFKGPLKCLRKALKRPYNGPLKAFERPFRCILKCL